MAQLNEEYAKLLAEKKACYEEYKKARQDMIDYQSARASVDKILGASDQEQEKRGSRERGADDRNPCRYPSGVSLFFCPKPNGGGKNARAVTGAGSRAARHVRKRAERFLPGFGVSPTSKVTELETRKRR